MLTYVYVLKTTTFWISCCILKSILPFHLKENVISFFPLFPLYFSAFLLVNSFYFSNHRSFYKPVSKRMGPCLKYKYRFDWKIQRQHIKSYRKMYFTNLYRPGATEHGQMATVVIKEKRASMRSWVILMERWGAVSHFLHNRGRQHLLNRPHSLGS